MNKLKIDLEHLHHWMCAIRESENPNRTLDAFWRGQISSKEWLIDNLRNYIKPDSSVDIFGGWVGVLASMLFQSDLAINSIRSIDIDKSCELIANRMNQIEFEQEKFKAITSDMCLIKSYADVIINTSCEHITQEQYRLWLSKQSNDALIVIQSNNYRDIEEHINCMSSLEEFKSNCDLEIEFADVLRLPIYDRYMIIGKKKN